MIRSQVQSDSCLQAAPEGLCCPACGSADLTDFFNIPSLPVHVGVLWNTQDEARSAPRGEITLSYCHGCGFVYNRDFETDKMWFDSEYEVALRHSEMFRNFMENLARRLIDRYQLGGKKVIEIGCGAGYFLRLLAKLGGVHGIGFDKSVSQVGCEQVGRGSVEFVREYFSKKYADLQAELLCCLSVFEDIPQPSEFLIDLRKIIGPRPMNIYFEIFNAWRAIQQQETWSIHYEQCNYFGLESFACLFEQCGFDVIEAAGCYGNDQYIYVEATARADWQPSASRLPMERRELPDEIADFSAIHQQKIVSWKQRLEQFQQENKRVVVWGSGGKGISFLNALPSEGRIEYVVDINPDRQEKYLPGTAQKVVAPEFLVQYKPDAIILTNILYEEEIRQQVAALEIESEFLSA